MSDTDRARIIGNRLRGTLAEKLVDLAFHSHLSKPALTRTIVDLLAEHDTAARAGGFAAGIAADKEKQS